MGSNKVNENSGVGGRWKNVQGDGNTSAFGTAKSSAVAEEDSSGMAWVKKRKEEREAKKREEEIKAKAEATAAAPPSEEEPKEEERTPKLRLDTLPSPSTSPLQSPTQQSPRPTHTPQDSADHVYTAVSLPPNSHKHQPHPHTHKRDLSAYRIHSPIIQSPSSEEKKELGIIDLNSVMTNAGAVEVVDKQLEIVADDSNGSTSEEEDSSSVTDEEEDSDSDSDSEVCHIHRLFPFRR